MQNNIPQFESQDNNKDERTSEIHNSAVSLFAGLADIVAPPLVRILWRAYVNPSLTSDDLNVVVDQEIMPRVYKFGQANSKARGSDPGPAPADFGGATFGPNDIRDLRAARTFSEYIDSIVTHTSTQQAISQLSGEAKEAVVSICDLIQVWSPPMSMFSPQLVSSVREVNREFLIWLRSHPDVLDDLYWEAFEKIVAEIFASRGFKVDLTGRVRNRSADVIAVRTDAFGVETRYLIECKRFSQSHKVGFDIVNGVIGAARRANTDHAFLVTTSSFTREVLKHNLQLQDLRIHLRDGENVRAWLLDYKPRSDGLWLSEGWNTKE